MKNGVRRGGQVNQGRETKEAESRTRFTRCMTNHGHFERQGGILGEGLQV